ncbi:hypothetical protein BV898_03381 [Hypsibius exemplaris]|uniref:ALMS motif domain-containing protein n=1 Tax=Hypsibius exemplaris TaxID=2072580 RepID=A0A1W0X4X2_HYPEX|nr:hypothetical protein BV898_03381 [Hypsibius exemplaris]
MTSRPAVCLPTTIGRPSHPNHHQTAIPTPPAPEAADLIQEETAYSSTAASSSVSHCSSSRSGTVFSFNSSPTITDFNLDSEEHSHRPITSRSVTLYGGTLTACVPRHGFDSFDGQRYPPALRVVQGLLQTSGKVHLKPTCLEEHAEERARRLAQSFSHMQIDRKSGRASFRSQSSRSLPVPMRKPPSLQTVRDKSSYFPARKKNASMSTAEEYERVLANERMGSRLQRIYAKPRAKRTEPVKIRSRWEMAEAERHREIHRLNKVSSRALLDRKSVGLIR